MAQSSVRRRLNVVLVSSDANFRAYLRRVLEQSCRIVGEGDTSGKMVRIVLEQKPDVVMFEMRLPDGNGLEVLRRIYDEHDAVAAVVIAEAHDQDAVQDALEQYYLTWVFKPAREGDLCTAVVATWLNFDHIHHLAQENDALRQQLEERKLIEQAKGILMKLHNWTEKETYKRFQRHSMNSRKPMIDLARAIIAGEPVKFQTRV